VVVTPTGGSAGYERSGRWPADLDADLVDEDSQQRFDNRPIGRVGDGLLKKPPQIKAIKALGVARWVGARQLGEELLSMGPQARGRFGEGAHALAAHRRLQRSSLEGEQVALDRLLVAADLAINHGELFRTLGVLVGSSPPRLDRFGEQIVLLGGGLACAPRTVLLAGVGVTPQDCGALGKVANCQVGVSVHAATDQASCPIDWRLFLPPSGTTTPSGAARPTCPTTCTIGPSGSWPWTWWTSWPAGSWPRR